MSESIAVCKEKVPLSGKYKFFHQRGIIVGKHYAGARTIGEMEQEQIVTVEDEFWSNLLTNQGLQGLLDASFALNTGLFIDLIGATPTIAAGDTAATHAGWTFFTAYAEAARQAWTTTRTGQVRSNSASLATFNVNATGTIGGASVFTNSTKSGTSGVLFSAGARAGGNLGVVNTDIVRVQYDLTAASA